MQRPRERFGGRRRTYALNFGRILLHLLPQVRERAGPRGGPSLRPSSAGPGNSPLAAQIPGRDGGAGARRQKRDQAAESRRRRYNSR